MGKEKSSNKFTNMGKDKHKAGKDFFSVLRESSFSLRRLIVDRFKIDSDLKMVVMKIVMIIILPIILIWSIRTIFDLSLVITFKTWFAGILLIVALRLIFKDMDVYRKAPAKVTYKERETSAEYPEYKQETGEFYGKKHEDLPEKSIYLDEACRVEDEIEHAEVEKEDEVLDLGDMVRPGADFVTRQEVMEEIRRLGSHNGYVTRRELIEQLNDALVALTEKEKQIIGDR